MFWFDFEMRLEIGGLAGIRRWGCEAIIVDCRLKKNGTADSADDEDYCNLIGDCGAVEKVPLILYHVIITLNYFQGWKLC